MRKLLITCEHSGNKVPPEFQQIFDPFRALLGTHRGHDIGIFALFQDLAENEAHFSISQVFTRLLVDCNRSLSHPELFSVVTQSLEDYQKEVILNQYYHPYRLKIQQTIAQWLEEGHEVLHISLHSFPSLLNGVKREFDTGIIFDPSLEYEQRFASILKEQLQTQLPKAQHLYNEPYHAGNDIITHALRNQFSHPSYAGLEWEINQEHTAGSAAKWNDFRKAISKAFKEAWSTYKRT